MRAECLVLLAICIALISSKSLSEFRIFNGNDASEGEFPYQASFRKKDAIEGYRHFCGAVIINNRFLLTAAHCCYFGFKGVGDAIVVVGALRRSGDGITMDVNKVTPHEDHDVWTMKNDIGLIRTVKNIIFSDELQPIALPIEYDVVDKKQLIASGWGKVGTETRPVLLQYVEVLALNLDECKKSHHSTISNRVYDSNVCTYGKFNASPCEGDSGERIKFKRNSNEIYHFYITNIGGPLVDPIHRTLVGLVSWGSKASENKIS